MAAEYRVYENVSERKAQFGERCVLTALCESSKCSQCILTHSHYRQRAAYRQRPPHLWQQAAGGAQMVERRCGPRRRFAPSSRS